MPASPPPPRTLLYYSDYSCPLSYLGKQLFDQYTEFAVFPVDREYRFFDLYGYIRSPDGDLDQSLDQSEDNYQAQLRESAIALADRLNLGLSLHVSQEVDSWNAHQAGLYVKQEYPTPVFEAFHTAVFDALWRSGRDISDVDVLGRIGEHVGLTATEIHDAVNDTDLHETLQIQFKQIANRRRPISPMIVYQKLASYGVTPFDDIRRLVEAGEGHPADERGAQWFRYHEYFSN